MSRTVVAALLSWASAAAAVLAVCSGGAARAVLAAAVLAVPVTLAWLVALGRAGRASAVALAACVLAAAGVAAWRTLPLAEGVLAGPAAEHAFVRAEAVTTSDARAREGRVSGPRRSDAGIAVDVDLATVTLAGTAVRVDLPAVLLVSGDGAQLARPLLPGSRLAVSGRLLPAAPQRGLAATLIAERLEVLDGAGMVQRAAGAVRASMRRAVEGRGPDVEGLLPGLVLGDTSASAPDLDQAMRGSGLSHLTAVSGGNVAVVVAMAVVLGRRVGLRRGRLRLAVVALSVAGYVVVARPEPSVLRAAAMAGLALGALALDLRARPRDVLAASVLVLVLVDPFLALSAGFAMSVAATAALIVVAERAGPSDPAATRAGRARRALVAALAVSAAAQAAVAPVVVAIGGGVPVGGLPANLLAAPAVVPATSLGVLASLLGLVWPGAATVVAVPAGWAVMWIAAVARTTSGLLGSLDWPSGAAGAAVLTAVLLLCGAAVLLLRRHGSRAATALSWAVAGVCGLSLLTPVRIPIPGVASWPPAGWRIVMCDVGQGDATVLRVADSEAVVVDAGPDPSAVDRCLRRLGIVRVPLLVLTHFHADHVEGLPGVLRGRRVGAVATSPLTESEDEADRVRTWLAEAGVGSRPAGLGDSWTVRGVHLDVVWPARIIRGEGSDANNASVTLVGSVDGVSVALGGDLETAAQDALLARIALPDVDVVKVPHHGSRHQSQRWASVLAPSIALIGVGEGNDYGHPAASTLAAYEAVGAVVGRTDLDGDLAVVAGDDGSLQLLRRGV